MQSAHDPSLTSHYVTDAFYQELVDAFTDWQRDDLLIGDTVERDTFRALLEREARRLDLLERLKKRLVETDACGAGRRDRPSAGPEQLEAVEAPGPNVAQKS